MVVHWAVRRDEYPAAGEPVRNLAMSRPMEDAFSQNSASCLAGLGGSTNKEGRSRASEMRASEVSK